MPHLAPPTPAHGPLSTIASRRGFLLVALAALCWGTSGISGRIVAERSGLGPLDIAWHRMALGALVLLAGTALARRRRPGRTPRLTRGTGVRLLRWGPGRPPSQFAYFSAVATAGVSIATLVALGMAPMLIAVGAAVLRHGRPRGSTLVALAVALAGVVLLVGISAGAGTGTAVVLGALMALGSALGYAVVTLAGSGVPPAGPGAPARLPGGGPRGPPAGPGPLGGFAGGALLLPPVVLAVALRFTADPVALAVLLYLGAVPSALAYALFFAGLRPLPGPVASIVTLREPLTATALATAFLGERLAPGALAGGLLVLAAVAGLYLRRMGDSNSRGVAPNPLSKRAP